MKKNMIMILLILLSFELGCFIKNKKIYELEQINKQLRLEYDELKIQNHELGWELHNYYYALDRTEEYCHASK